MDGLGEGETRVHCQPFRAQHHVLHGDAIHADEAASFGVEGLTVLSLSSGGLDLARVGMDPDIADHLECGPIGMRGDGEFATDEPCGEVNPTVRADHGFVHAQLRAFGGVEPGDPHLAMVGFSIAIGVLEEQEVGGCCHEKSVTEREDTVGKGESGGENRATVHGAVMVGVFEEHDVAEA